MHIFFITLSLILTLNINLFASDGEKLFQEKCASCHTIEIPADKSTLIAPPLKGFMFHMSEHFKTKKEMLAHINSFVMDPSEEKAVCKGVRRFGLMPSQKGLLTQKELNTIAKWIVKTSAKDCSR